jgi:lactate dehydrogenase-like 2-hydroxyacid dehydrogenase
MEILKKLPNLKMISKYGVGLDNINIKDCKDLGITLGWTPGVNKRSVSEMVLGFMLGLARNLSVTHLKLKEGIWHKDGGVPTYR